MSRSNLLASAVFPSTVAVAAGQAAESKACDQIAAAVLVRNATIFGARRFPICVHIHKTSYSQMYIKTYTETCADQQMYAHTYTSPRVCLHIYIYAYI